MAVDGKNASGRLASATVFWLLVAIFANQDYVYCEGEEVQQEFNSRLQQQQQQQQFQPPQQQQQQQQPLTQQQQQQPLTQQQQQLQLPQMQLPQPQMQLPQPQMQPPQSQMQLPQTQMQLPQPQIPLQQLQQPPPNQQLNQQQQRPPNQQLNQQQQRPPNQQLEPLQELGKPSPTNMLNDLQLNLNKLSPGQLMNSDFGQGPTKQPQQSLSNVGVPANMPGGGRMPSYLDNPSQVLNYDETKLPQGANLPFHVNSPFDNNQQKYPEQNMQQKPMMQYLPNHYLSRPFMGQQIPRPYQPQLYFNNGNADNMYDVQASTGPSAGYPGQSYPNTNTGDQMGSAQTFNKMISTDPIELVQKPIGLFINSVDKLSRYGAGVKDALTRVFNEGMGKLFDESQSGAHKVYGYGLAGTDAALELGRRLLVSDPRSQQAGDSVGRYNSPLQQQNYNGFNPNQQTPTHAMGYAPAVQPNAQGAVPQIDYSQQRPGTNYLQGANGGNPINAPQPIFRYGLN